MLDLGLDDVAIDLNDDDDYQNNNSDEELNIENDLLNFDSQDILEQVKQVVS